MAEETLSPIPQIHEDESFNGMGKDETSEPHETKIDSDKSPEEIEHRQDATLLPGTANDEIKIGAWRIYRPNTEFDGLFQSRIYFSVEASFEAMPGMHFRLNNKIISQACKRHCKQARKSGPAYRFPFVKQNSQKKLPSRYLHVPNHEKEPQKQKYGRIRPNCQRCG